MCCSESGEKQVGHIFLRKDVFFSDIKQLTHFVVMGKKISDRDSVVRQHLFNSLTPVMNIIFALSSFTPHLPQKLFRANLMTVLNP